MRKSLELSKNVKNLWETLEIRVLILTSQLIQILLASLAPLRKRSSNSFLMFSIWVLYLSADAIAALVIGLISSNKGTINPELLAFWATFLLIHLGGPDTITALALVDNELWRRHALQLATQVIITIYVFLQSFHHTDLLLPALLMFTSGFIKCFERTSALFFASSDRFRDSLVLKPEPGLNYPMIMEAYSAAKSAHIPTEVFCKSDLSHLGNQIVLDTVTRSSLLGDDEVKESVDMVLQAYKSYEISKPFLTDDGLLSLKDRDLSRMIFLNGSYVRVFRIIQIELNLIYDIFYTKLCLFQNKRVFARVFCLVLTLVSLVIFNFQDKSRYSDDVDVIVTFILFGGAIAFDILAALSFVLSDWWIILTYQPIGIYLQTFTMIVLKWSRWARQRNHKRWANSISKYNLLNRCFRKPPSFFNLISLLKIKEINDILIGFFYVKEEPIEEQLINYVIKGMLSKARQANEMAVAKEVCSARGNLFLESDYFFASECLSPWTVDIDYDESFLIWHLATDICYWTTSYNKDDGASASEYRKFSKALADYMAYVLLMKREMVSVSLLSMLDTRFEDTCAEAKNFMNDKCISIDWLADPWWKAKRFMSASSQDKSPSENAEAEFFKEFSKKVLEVRADVEPIMVKGDKSKSVLFDACRLAKQLELFEEKQWEVTSKVWVELLCYAAVHFPSPRPHIARLSSGGEIITIVWLFMIHLGLGERFMMNRGFGTKFIIHK